VSTGGSSSSHRRCVAAHCGARDRQDGRRRSAARSAVTGPTNSRCNPQPGAKSKDARRPFGKPTAATTQRRRECANSSFPRRRGEWAKSSQNRSVIGAPRSRGSSPLSRGALSVELGPNLQGGSFLRAETTFKATVPRATPGDRHNDEPHRLPLCAARVGRAQFCAGLCAVT
jgi:hypothetical protein